jgi:hypothetical protein
VPYLPQAQIYCNVLNRNVISSKSEGHVNELMRPLRQEHQVIANDELMSVCLTVCLSVCMTV